MRLYAEQIQQIDKAIQPFVDKINVDEHSLLKFTQAFLDWRIITHVFTLIILIMVNGYNEETGEKLMNVAPETAKFWTIFWIFDWIGIPADITYGVLLNAAENGETWRYAANGRVQAATFSNLVYAGIGSIFGIVFNIVFQLVLWIYDLGTIDVSNAKIFEVMEMTFRNFFDNVFYEGFKPSIFFIPFYTLFGMALPYSLYIWNVMDD